MKIFFSELEKSQWYCKW